MKIGMDQGQPVIIAPDLGDDAGPFRLTFCIGVRHLWLTCANDAEVISTSD